jgi:hypothetical protein
MHRAIWADPRSVLSVLRIERFSDTCPGRPNLRFIVITVDDGTPKRRPRAQALG